MGLADIWGKDGVLVNAGRSGGFFMHMRAAMAAKGLIANFGACRGGSIAILFAFSILALMSAIGMSVDYGLALAEKQRLQKAVDAASLSAATLLEDNDSLRVQRALAVFRENYSGPASLMPSFVIEPGQSGSGKRVVGHALHSMPTHIMGLFGYQHIPVQAAAKVPVAALRDVEVVLVLDYSDSMIANDKYIRMKEAAHQLIDTISDAGSNPNVKFAIVPFAAMVRVDLPPWAIRSDVSYSGCTQDRRHPANTREERPTAANDTRWGEVTSSHTCADMTALGLKVVPLNSNVAAVKAKLTAMQPYMWTHIALGAEIGFQALSPDGVVGGAADYDTSQTLKVFILLTDGMQTAPGWGPGGLQSPYNGEENLKSLCGAMKTRGIAVYTIGYDLSDQHTLDLLHGCASAGGFYDAADIANGLIQSLGSVARKVREQMVVLAE
ncbi:MAG: pilus assembly protein [Hyphomicrobiaceae bacterium]|nr:pilus assembly protein [Hyphomicrobiaceae bacterium]